MGERQAAAATMLASAQETRAENQATRAAAMSNFMTATGAMVTTLRDNHRAHMSGFLGGAYGGGAAGTTTTTTTTGDADADEVMPMAMESEGSSEECETVVATASSVDDLSLLVEAVTAAGTDVVDLLSDKDSKLTVLAPTNDAFTALLDALSVTKEQLFSNQTLLLGVLSYHVIPGAAVTAAELTDGQELETLLGDTIPLTVKKAGDDVTFEGVGSDASVVIPDVEACAAVVHVIDAVLLPVG